MPESKADLLASVNEAAGLVQKVFFTYLLVSLYLAVLIGSTTHEQMLRESGVQLPLFGVGLSVFWVYAVAPWLYLALHVNLLVQHYLLSRKLYAFNAALERPDKEGRPLSEEEEDEWRVRLYPSMFAQMLAGAERGAFKRLVLCSIVFLTVAVAPVVLLIWMQAQFLPYHSEKVTLGHQLALVVALVMLWYYWPQMMTNKEGSWWRIIVYEHPRLRAGVCAVFSFAALSFSAFVAVVPGGHWERTTGTETANDWWRDSPALMAVCESAGQTEPKPEEPEPAAASRRADKRRRASGSASIGDGGTPDQGWIVATTTSVREILSDAATSLSLAYIRRTLLTRYLDVRGEKLLDDEPPPELLAALIWDEDEKEKLRERTVGLDLERRDLRGAVLRGANLTKADLTNAKLHGAHLGCAKLEEADMEGAVLHGAMLSGIELQQATLNRVEMTGGAPSLRKGLKLTSVKMNDARLIGASLSNVGMIDARLKGALLQGANLASAKLQDADLQRARLEGANLQNADLRDADLSRANLRGANLRGAKIAGAKFTNAVLDYADLRNVNYWSLTSTDIEDGDKIVRLDLHTVDSLVAEKVLCNDQMMMKERESLKCVKEGEIANYNGGLVKDVLKDLVCVESTFKDPLSSSPEAKVRPLSAAEAKALLMTWRSIMTDRDSRNNNSGAAKNDNSSKDIEDKINKFATQNNKTSTQGNTSNDQNEDSSSILALSLATIQEETCYFNKILNQEEINNLLIPKKSESST